MTAANSSTNARHGVARVIIAQNKSFATKIAKVIVTVYIPPVAVMATAPKISYVKVIKASVIPAMSIPNALQDYANNINVLQHHKTIGKNKY